jgi:cardiolipin synthase
MLRDGLIRTISVLAPLSAAQYAWIVFRRINTPQQTVV